MKKRSFPIIKLSTTPILNINILTWISFGWRLPFCINLTFYLITSFIFKKIAVQHQYVNPCQPSPCGPNSQCREINEQAVCSCLPNYMGSPPGCRPECVSSSECRADKACVNQKCVDPCPGVCATNANCRVNNHSPICICNNGFTGDPLTRCYPIPRKFRKVVAFLFRFMNDFMIIMSSTSSDCSTR